MSGGFRPRRQASGRNKGVLIQRVRLDDGTELDGDQVELAVPVESYVRMDEISVRYIVDDVDKAAEFYVTHLDFELVMRPGPGFAMLRRGNLRLLLNSPGGGGGAGQTLSDGSRPEPGGWNRFQIAVDDLDVTHAKLRAAGAAFRGDIITGIGGRQALLQDPAGNLVELFESAAG